MDEWSHCEECAARKRAREMALDLTGTGTQFVPTHRISRDLLGHRVVSWSSTGHHLGSEVLTPPFVIDDVRDVKNVLLGNRGIYIYPGGWIEIEP